MPAPDYKKAAQILEQSRKQKSSKAKSVELQQLENQLLSQRRQLGYIDPDLAKKAKDVTKRPSVVERVFDVLSRGQYASANVIGGLVDKGPEEKGVGELVTAGKNIWAGLSGKKKGSFSKVLEEAGVKNKWVKTIGGLAGDVLLDPTTYVGTGVVKAAGKATKTAVKAEASLKAAADISQAQKILRKVAKAEKEFREGGKAVTGGQLLAKKTAKEFLTTKAAYSAKEADKAAVAARNALKQSDPKATSEMLRQAGNEARSAYRLAQLDKVGVDAVKALEIAEPGRVAFKFAGKEILGTQALGKALYKAGPKAGTAIAATKYGGKLAATATKYGGRFNELFRTASMFPEHLNNLRRVHVAAGIAELDERVTQIRNIFKGVSKEDDELIQRGLLGEEDLVGMGRQDLADKVQDVRALYDEFWTASGKRADDPAKMQNFANVYLGNRNHKDFQKYKKAFEQGKLVTVGKGKNATQVKVPGMKLSEVPPELRPTTRASHALSLYAANHYKKQSHRDIMKAFEKDFGITGSTKQGRDWIAEGVKKGELKKQYSKHFDNEEVYFPDQVAKAIKHLGDMHADEKLADGFIRLFDKVQGQVKFFQTAANPGHHIRNMAGDIYMNYLDGVTNPLVYKQAANILAQVGQSKKAGAIEKILGGGKTGQFTVRIGKVDVSAEDLWYMYKNSGAKSGFFRTEMVEEGGLSKLRQGMKPKEIFGTAQESIRKGSEVREDIARLAHFIDVMKKEGKNFDKYDYMFEGSKFKKAADLASKRVRKWNLDYGDLTPFEEKVMKRVIPFYTWMRKAIPLQVEALAMHPGRIAALPKSWQAMGQLTGDPDRTSIGGPETIPQYIRDMAGVRLVGEGESGLLSKAAMSGGNAVHWLPVRTPLHDLSEMLSGNKEENLKQVLSNLTPALRIPVEQATGREFFGNIPIKNQTKYAAGQIPAARYLYQLYESRKEDKGFDLGKFVRNWVAGQSTFGVTESSKKSELRRQQDIVEAILRQAKAKHGYSKK